MSTSANHQQKPHDKDRHGIAGRGGQRLHCPYGAAAKGTGAGIAVEPRYAELFERAPIEPSGKKAIQMGIGENGHRPLDQSPVQPMQMQSIQFRHTPDTD